MGIAGLCPSLNAGDGHECAMSVRVYLSGLCSGPTLRPATSCVDELAAPFGGCGSSLLLSQRLTVKGG